MSMPDFQSVLLAVWQQTLIDNARNVTVAGETFPVRTTPEQKLKQIDFRFDGREIRGLEQTLQPSLAGLQWRERVRRSCSSWSTEDTWQQSLTAKFIATEGSSKSGKHRMLWQDFTCPVSALTGT